MQKFNFLIPVLVVIAVIVIYLIKTVNSLKRKQVKIEEALSGIDVALEKRYDALKKMLDVAKSYAKFEKETILEALKIRTGSTIQEKVEFEKQMNLALGEISLVAEQYPELRSNEQFVIIQKAIIDAEEHIQASRRAYNANVSSINKMIVSFPSSAVAKLVGIQKVDFFEVSDEKKADIDMNFNI